jgi:hypothetical protein
MSVYKELQDIGIASITPDNTSQLQAEAIHRAIMEHNLKWTDDAMYEFQQWIRSHSLMGKDVKEFDLMFKYAQKLYMTLIDYAFTPQEAVDVLGKVFD